MDRIRCDYCGCAFTPEFHTAVDGDIEYTFFRCGFCGKAYMVSVTDSCLREGIAEYVRLAEKNRLQELKAANVARARQLKEMYIREDGSGNGDD